MATTCTKCGLKVWTFDMHDMVLGWATDYCKCEEAEDG